MWKKTLIILVLFYLFALLQNSFFIYFVFWGALPNLVFIFFFLLVFFSKGANFSTVIFAGASAGFFLDIFSYTYIGPSVILLVLIGFLLKKTRALLKNKGDNYPFAYFLSLFVVYFIVYKVLFMFCSHFIYPEYALVGFNLISIAEIVYSLFFATIGFLIFKKNVQKI